jgi:hypothetical protein
MPLRQRWHKGTDTVPFCQFRLPFQQLRTMIVEDFQPRETLREKKILRAQARAV